jgi:hypothetical protein
MLEDNVPVEKPGMQDTQNMQPAHRDDVKAIHEIVRYPALF